MTSSSGPHVTYFPLTSGEEAGQQHGADHPVPAVHRQRVCGRLERRHLQDHKPRQ